MRSIFQNKQLFIAIVCFLCVLCRIPMAQAQSHMLGTIGDKVISEGDLLSFGLELPKGFGPDVIWSVKGLPGEASFSDIPAFPGAEGFGMGTRGGRGGRVIKVTNLHRTGPGSLHDALLVNEPRIILFDVSGVIDCPLPTGGWLLKKSHRLYAANAPVTIAGQTAPGAGITINGLLNLAVGDGGECVDDVIVRFLRLRAPFHQGSEGDNLRAGGDRAIFDHLSGAWGSDENFDLSNLRNATIQWSGIEEAAGYGSPWDPHLDRDGDGMLDHWEMKVVEESSTGNIKDFVLDVRPGDDLDEDGATNLEEHNKASNPLIVGTEPFVEWDFNHDSDNDGLADWWEQKAIDASVTDGVAALADIGPDDDLDGDLSSNYEEYKVGTNPLEAPKHNFGMIMGYKGKDISLHHNFFAHHKIRTPLSGVETLDHRNNIIYNCGLGLTWHPMQSNQQRPGELFRTNIVGNYFKVGPNSPKKDEDHKYYNPFIENGRSVVYSNDNYFDMLDEPQGNLDIFNSNRKFIYNGGPEQRVDLPYPVLPIETDNVLDAYPKVLAHAGCLPKDAITTRNVEEIKTRTGKWGKEFPENGLLQGLSPANPPADSDDDGMPDQWEIEHGLNHNDGSDYNTIVKGGDSSLNYKGKTISGTENRYKGYTYIEYYINEKADQLILEELYENELDETSLPGFNLTSQPVLSWNPDYDQAGDYEFVIQASDGAQTLSETVRVKVGNTNRKPFIYHIMEDGEGGSINQYKGVTIEPGEQLFVEFYVKEPDQDDYTVSVENGPGGGNLTDTNQVRTNLKGEGTYDVYTYIWSPAIEDVGWSNTITFIATDSEGQSFSRGFKLTVNEFQGQLFTVQSQASEGGSLLPNGEITVKEGENITVFIKSDNDYRISDVLVDGLSVGAQAVYTFSDVSGNHNIQGQFVYSPGTIGGLILKMSFDENMEDTSGYGNHGVVLDQSFLPELTFDRFGNPNSAYEFDGKDDFIEISDTSAFHSSEYTMAAWVNSRSDYGNGGSSGQFIISKGWTGNSIDVSLGWDKIYTSGKGYPCSEDGVLKGLENQWIHIAVVKGNELAHFYVNGEPKGSFETYPCEGNGSSLKIGARGAYPVPAALYFNGKIDDVQVFNKALTVDEIKKLYGGNSGELDPIKPPTNLRGLSQ
jgi:hypothetical protein